MAEELTRRGVPAVVCVVPRAEPSSTLLDRLRELLRAARALLAVGRGDVVYLEASGTIHGFWSLRKLLPSSASDVARCLAHLKLMIAA